jgi:hypothetical protein
VDELEAAEKVWYLVVQEECFANDRKSAPLMDEEGVIRVAALKGLNRSALQ